MELEVLLSFYPKITRKRYRDLVRISPTWDSIQRLTRDMLLREGWKEDVIDHFLSWRKTVDEEKIEKILHQQGIQTIGEKDAHYPELLKAIYDPPCCLFVRGDTAVLNTAALGIVGTRKQSPYGVYATKKLVTELVGQQITIISGLAMGIDGTAHAATLEAGGKTIAVLGSGIDDAHVFPALHRNLAKKIVASGGAVISEYPPGGLPSPFTFPKRNRIIAGLSLGVVVVEAGETSGALITAQYALDHGREVFAIPHPIGTPGGIGPNHLIQNGAKLVTEAKEIIETVGLVSKEPSPLPEAKIALSGDEQALYSLLSHEPLHIDEIIKKAPIERGKILGILTLMEMNGLISAVNGKMYHRVR